MRSLTLFAAATLAATPAFALSTPTPSAKDANVRTEAYDPQNRTSLVMQVGRATDITFDINERIKTVLFDHPDGPVGTLCTDKCDKALGESKPPDPMINNLPLTGLAAGHINLIVVTLAIEGQERPYFFSIDVVAAPRDPSQDDPRATYSLTFTYPIQQHQVAVQAAQVSWKDRQATKAQQIAEARLNVDPLYGVQNFQYMVQAKTNTDTLVPPQVSDNGRITAFSFPGNMEHPAIFLVRDGISRPEVCDGKKPTTNDAPEEALDTQGINDLIVVHRTAPHFRLRAGTAVAEIYNCAWNAIGSNPGTGTTSPDVIRKVITTSAQ